MSHIAVIDIGKTNAKLALVDSATLNEIAVVTRPNKVLPGPPWPHFDLDGHWDFLLDGLAAFHAEHGVDAISVTTHGASIVLLDKAGRLAAPMLDYEHHGPDALSDAYDRIRPEFSLTGSPRLPMGLNVGAQLHYMFHADPGIRDRTATLLTYPQYWSWRLTGFAGIEATSMGCHTDLWEPDGARLSPLGEALGIASKFPPLIRASDPVGTVLPEIAQRTGLGPDTPVHSGIHDSNASLLPHVLRREPPYSVISTGTWVIVMTMGGGQVTLDPARDTLINVNALGQPVPSARFMGGREHDLISEGQGTEPSDAELAEVLDSGVMLLPAVVPDSGPFAGQTHRWQGSEPALGSARRSAALGYYLALMTAECLSLTGHRGEIVVEGPFARNRAYLLMLNAVTGCRVLPAGGATGTAQGAAMLALDARALPPVQDPEPVRAADPEPFRAYAKNWRAAAKAS